VVNVLWSILWFLVATSALVTAHELGHFWVARRCGIKVLRFSIGFGPPLLSWTSARSQIRYTLCALPLGGFVQMLVERVVDVAAENFPHAFTSVHPLKRVLTLLAGPAFNFILAIILLFVLLWGYGAPDVRPVLHMPAQGTIAAQAGIRAESEIIAVDGAKVLDLSEAKARMDSSILHTGMVKLTLEKGGTQYHVTVRAQHERDLRSLGLRFVLPYGSTIIEMVYPGSPAARAGLMAGDKIVAIDGHALRQWKTLVHIVSAGPGKRFLLSVRRGHRVVQIPVVAARNYSDGKIIGRLGIRGGSLVIPKILAEQVRYPFFRSLIGAVRLTEAISELEAKMVWDMITFRTSIHDLSGPVGIAVMAGQSASQGVSSFFFFLAQVSISLGMLNLLPIPALDGGGILFQLAEWIRRKPVNLKLQLTAIAVGLSLIFVLLGVALYSDITRLFAS